MFFYNFTNIIYKISIKRKFAYVKFILWINRDIPLTQKVKNYELNSEFETYVDSLKEKYSNKSKRKIAKGTIIQIKDKTRKTLNNLEEKELPKIEPPKTKCIKIKKPVVILEQP